MYTALGCVCVYTTVTTFEMPFTKLELREPILLFLSLSFQRKERNMMEKIYFPMQMFY